jgi:hypothetical protein
MRVRVTDCNAGWGEPIRIDADRRLEHRIATTTAARRGDARRLHRMKSVSFTPHAAKIKTSYIQ